MISDFFDNTVKVWSTNKAFSVDGGVTPGALQDPTAITLRVFENDEVTQIGTSIDMKTQGTRVSTGLFNYVYTLPGRTKADGRVRHKVLIQVSAVVGGNASTRGEWVLLRSGE